MLQSDTRAQPLSVFGPLSVKEGNNLKNNSRQAKSSGFFEFCRRDFTGLVKVFFTFSVPEMIKLSLSVLAHKQNSLLDKNTN